MDYTKNHEEEPTWQIYSMKLYFKGEPKCNICLLSGSHGKNMDGETITACYGLGTRLTCPEDGCRKDCPLLDNIER